MDLFIGLHFYIQCKKTALGILEPFYCAEPKQLASIPIQSNFSIIFLKMFHCWIFSILHVVVVEGQVGILP